MATLGLNEKNSENAFFSLKIVGSEIAVDGEKIAVECSELHSSFCPKLLWSSTGICKFPSL
jgi:hypothetical protein